MMCNVIQKRLNVRFILFVFFQITILQATLFAQNQPQVILSKELSLSKLCGVVKGGKKSFLIGANVYIKELKRGVLTNERGEYSLSDIPAGSYKVLVSFLGYYPTIIDLKIKKNQKKQLNFSLKPKALDLFEVSVSAKSKAREIKERAMPTTVIEMEQLQGTVSNVQDVLAKSAGVTIRSTGGLGSASRISVRGLEGKRIGLFIDGLPMGDNSDFIDINDIPVEMIERIEIYKGIVPAKFGGSSIGGAVNLIIKEYPPKYLDVNYTIESYNTHKVRLVTKRNLAPKGLEFGFGGFYNYSDNNYEMQSPFDEDLKIERDHDKFQKYCIAGSLKARKWWFDLVELEGVYMNSYKEIQGIEYNIQEAHNKADIYLLSNKLEKEDFFLPGLDLEANLAYAYTSFNAIDTSSVRYNWDGTTYPAVSNLGGEIGKWASFAKNKKHTLMQKTNLNYTINEKHSLNLNTVFNFVYGRPQNKLKDQVVGYKTDYNSTMLSLVAGLAYDYRTTNDKFLNSLNAKYYTYSMATKQADLMSRKVMTIDMKKQNCGISNATRYRLTSDWMTKFSLAYDVRLPSESELLGDGYMIAPSCGLEPERNTSLNFGFLYNHIGTSKNNIQFETNVFYSYIENLIRYTGGYLKSQYQNFGEMRTAGIEAEIKGDITPYLYGYWNVTFQDLRDERAYRPNSKIPNGTKGDRMPNVPIFMSNMGVEFHKENLFRGKEQNTRILLDGSFIDDYFYDFEQSKLQERKIPRSFVFNLSFEHSFMDNRLILTARINNLTDHLLISEFNRPLPGRNMGVRLRYIMK